MRLFSIADQSVSSGGLESRHEDGKSQEQLPRAFPDQFRVGFGPIKVFQRTLHEPLDLTKPVSDASLNVKRQEL